MTPADPIHRFTGLLCLLIAGSWISAHDKPVTPSPIAGIENLRQVAPGLLSGSQPDGAAACGPTLADERLHPDRAKARPSPSVVHMGTSVINVV